MWVPWILSPALLSGPVGWGWLYFVLECESKHSRHLLCPACLMEASGRKQSSPVPQAERELAAGVGAQPF